MSLFINEDVSCLKNKMYKKKNKQQLHINTHSDRGNTACLSPLEKHTH